jgi:hypothetical protein
MENIKIMVYDDNCMLIILRYLIIDFYTRLTTSPDICFADVD